MSNVSHARPEAPIDVLARSGRRSLVPQDVVAAYLDLSEAALEQDRASGRIGIPYIRIGRSIKYDLNEIDEWLEKHRYRHARSVFDGAAKVA